MKYNSLQVMREKIKDQGSRKRTRVALIKGVPKNPKRLQLLCPVTLLEPVLYTQRIQGKDKGKEKNVCKLQGGVWKSKKCQLRNVPWVGKTSEESQLECRQSTHPSSPLSFPSHTTFVVISLHDGISPTFTHSHFKLIFPSFLLLAKDSQSPQKKSYLFSFIFICD